MGSRSVGRPRKRWIDNMNDCWKNRGSNVGQTRRMVYDSNEWWRFVRENAWDLDRRRGGNP